MKSKFTMTHTVAVKTSAKACDYKYVTLKGIQPPIKLPLKLSSVDVNLKLKKTYWDRNNIYKFAKISIELMITILKI